MTANRIAMQTSFSNIVFMPLPKQVKRVGDLPNWFITLGEKPADPNVKVYHPKSVKMYLQINQTEPAGPQDIESTYRAIDCMKTMFKQSEFVKEFGELVLNNWMQKAPNESENYRVGKELYNFFQRRGRNTKSHIESADKKCNSITLAMDSDVVFNTSCRSIAPSRRRGITGEVSIFGQHQYFSLQHPLFDLSLMMTGTDARKNVTQELRKAFPFIQTSDIKGWTFDTHVQGK